jgi:broad specificity phosphatase PhoE
MVELVLARHGQSLGNVEGTLGHDTDLTGLGRQQASRLGAWLAQQGYAFTAVYASPLRRAQQTAEIINTHYGLRVTTDPDLREAEVPYLHVLPQRSNPLSAEETQSFAEEYEQMRARVIRATKRILGENPEGQVLVVAHGGTLGTMVRTILGSHSLLVHTELAAAHSLVWQDNRWNVLYTNRREHLLRNPQSDTPDFTTE